MSTTEVSPPQAGWATVATVIFNEGGKGYDYFIPTNIDERIKPGTKLVVDVADTMKIVEIRSMRKATQVDHLKRALGVYIGERRVGELATAARSFTHYCTAPNTTASITADTTDEQEPKSMDQITIENKTLINGRDVGQYTNAELYRLISDAEKEIELLESIKHKPARLTKEIDSKRSALKGLISMLDELDSKAA